MLYQSNIVRSFRNSNNKWFQQNGRNDRDVYFTPIKRNKRGRHKYEQHVHLYIRDEGDGLGYNIKDQGESVEHGLLEDHWRAHDFEFYYQDIFNTHNSGGGSYVKKKTLKKKTLKKKTLKKKTLRKKKIFKRKTQRKKKRN